MPAAKGECVGGHQSVHPQLRQLGPLEQFGQLRRLIVCFPSARRHAQVFRPSQPGNTVIDDDSIRVAGSWRIGAESNGVAVFLRHRRYSGVVAIQYPNGFRREDARLRSSVGLQRVMPVKVIIGDIQHGRSVADKRARRSQLKARKLEHPHFGQIVFGQTGMQSVEGDRRDVAGDLYPLASGFNHQTREPAGRRFTVRAGDRDDLRCVAALRFQPRQLSREQLDLTEHFDLALVRRPNERCSG